MKVKVRAVILNSEGKILLQKLSLANGFWCLPGGTFEEGEILEECLVRELEEELGICAKLGEVAHVQSFVSQGTNHADMKGKSVIDIWYFIENPEDFVNIDLSKVSHGFESEKVEWFSYDTLPENHAPKHLGALVKAWKEGKRFINMARI